MDNNLNNNGFINKKNDMQRSTVAMAILLGIIIFLLIVIGYLIYLNLKRPDEIIVNKCEQEPTIVEKKNEKEESEEEEEVVTISDETLDSLIALLPKVLTTNFLDYNLFTKSGLTKEEIEAIKTSYSEENLKEVSYLPYQIEVTKKNTVLYLYVVIYDKKNNLYYDSNALDKEINNPLFDKTNQEHLKKYGGRYKITYVNGAFGYLLNRIEFINGKR